MPNPQEFNEPVVQPVQFAQFEKSEPPADKPVNTLDLLQDVPLVVTAELGRTKMLVKDILKLTVGSVIELDKLAGEPVDILVNGKIIARGEVIAVNENFGIRITEIVKE